MKGKKAGKNRKSAPRAKIQRKKTRSAPKQPVSLGKVVAEKKKNDRPTLLSFTLQILYKNLYLLGITLLRRNLRYKRKLKRFFTMLRGTTYALLERFGRFAGRCFRGILRRLKAPFVRIGDTWRKQKPRIAQAKEEGKFPLSSYLRVLYAVWHMIWVILYTIFNHVAPFAAAWLLIHTVNVNINQPLGLAVEYDGEIIGYVQSESKYDEAVQILRERFVGSDYFQLEMETPLYRLVGVSHEEEPEDQETAQDVGQKPFETPRWVSDNFMRVEVVEDDYADTEELADVLVQSSADDIEFASGFYVDSTFYGAVPDAGRVVEALEDIRERNSTGVEGERVEFLKRIALKEGYYPTTAVMETDDLINLMYSYETVQEIYVVEDGDTPSGISSNTGVAYDLLVELNPWIEDNLQPGDEILTNVPQPFLSVKNIYETEYEEELDYEVVEIETSTYAVGYRDVGQEGVPGIQHVRAEITMINGIEVDRTILETETVLEPVDERVTVGINDPRNIQSYGSGGGTGSGSGDRTPSSAAGSAGFIWPTSGGRATTYSGHTGNGVDIARPYNTPIYASASGTVVTAKYTYTGYGVHVIIDHGNGYQTLYAHANALTVSVGDTVSQGQVIGYIGRTGWATGNHVHFEVRQNGRYMWPPDFIGYSG